MRRRCDLALQVLGFANEQIGALGMQRHSGGFVSGLEVEVGYKVVVMVKGRVSRGLLWSIVGLKQSEPQECAQNRSTQERG